MRTDRFKLNTVISSTATKPLIKKNRIEVQRSCGEYFGVVVAVAMSVETVHTQTFLKYRLMARNIFGFIT